MAEVRIDEFIATIAKKIFMMYFDAVNPNTGKYLSHDEFTAVPAKRTKPAPGSTPAPKPITPKKIAPVMVDSSFASAIINVCESLQDMCKDVQSDDISVYTSIDSVGGKCIAFAHAVVARHPSIYNVESTYYKRNYDTTFAQQLAVTYKLSYCVAYTFAQFIRYIISNVVLQFPETHFYNKNYFTMTSAQFAISVRLNIKFIDSIDKEKPSGDMKRLSVAFMERFEFVYATSVSELPVPKIDPSCAGMDELIKNVQSAKFAVSGNAAEAAPAVPTPVAAADVAPAAAAVAESIGLDAFD